MHEMKFFNGIVESPDEDQLPLGLEIALGARSPADTETSARTEMSRQ
ncbi:MAG: hypothetical protein OEV40_06875 [Acidimicrobiia bacterium]|nr:hypothetical protein [Acidimicrobiia bacterium]